MNRLCKCGCGKKATQNREYFWGHKKILVGEFCKCGCGEIARFGRKYFGNHRAGSKPKKELAPPNLCVCGCGGYAKSGNRYICGHSGNKTKSEGIIRKALETRRLKGMIYVKSDPTLCACGCGEYANSGRKYIYNHHTKGRTVKRRSRKFPSKAVPCRCGCGEMATVGCRYVVGHSRRDPEIVKRSSKKFIETMTLRNRIRCQEQKLCRCGCRNLAGPGKEFVHGHNNKGKSPSNRTKILLSKNNLYDKELTCWKESGHLHLLPFEYRELLSAVRERDNNECIVARLLGEFHSDSGLDTHHVVPLRIGSLDSRCDSLGNLVCLCGRCHGKLRGGPYKEDENGRWRKFLPIACHYLSKFYNGADILALDHI